MRTYKVPEDCKEIVINEEGQLVYLKSELIEVQPHEWAVVKSWQLLEEINE